MKTKVVIRIHRFHSNTKLTHTIHTGNESFFGFQWVTKLPQCAILILVLHFDAGRSCRGFSEDEEWYVEGKAAREVSGARVNLDGIELCQRR